MSNSEYEALRQKIADYLTRQFVFDPASLPRDECYAEVDHILFEVFRTLETVTEKMIRACDYVPMYPTETISKREWLTMLRASPLNPNRGEGGE